MKEIIIYAKADKDGVPIIYELVSKIANICPDMRLVSHKLIAENAYFIAEYRYGAEVDFEDDNGVDYIEGSREWIKASELFEVELLEYYSLFLKLKITGFLRHVRIDSTEKGKGTQCFSGNPAMVSERILELTQKHIPYNVGKWNYTQKAEYRCFNYEVLRDNSKPLHWQNIYTGRIRQGMEVVTGGNTFFIDNEEGKGYQKLTNGGGWEIGHKNISEKRIIKYLNHHEWKKQ